MEIGQFDKFTLFDFFAFDFTKNFTRSGAGHRRLFFDDEHARNRINIRSALFVHEPCVASLALLPSGAAVLGQSIFIYRVLLSALRSVRLNTPVAGVANSG